MQILEIDLAALAPLLESEPVEPHPALTASIRPTPGQVYRAALQLGWYPETPFLRPAVPLRQEDLTMRHCDVTGLLIAECACGSCFDDDEQGLAYDASSGGLAVDIGDGLAIDTADGDLAVDIGGVAFDL